MSLFDSVKQSVHKTYTQAHSALTSTLKESKFLQEGVLTPEEVSLLLPVPQPYLSLFLLATCLCTNVPPGAGTLDTHSIDIFTARAAGDPKRAVSYLPSDKQFLITRNG